MSITVFTPTYNRVDKLERVYNSLKNQTLKKVDGKSIFEWLIVDDGSKDNTKELVKRWQKEADFPIRYIYQENQGKIKAMINGVENTNSELFLILDSDDECMPETIEFFYKTWNSFDEKMKKECNGISVLCQDQFGKRIGCDFPVEKKFIKTKEIFFKWNNEKLGEIWAILNTDILKKVFNLPEEAKNLKFIPESFFWNRVVFEINPYTYCVNKVLRIYYKNEEDNLSSNIRNKYPEGFLFESKWVINNYKFVFFKAPNIYIKYFLKYIIYSDKDGFFNLNDWKLKILYSILFIPSLIIKKFYLKDKI